MSAVLQDSPNGDPTGAADGVVARRIVMPREIWDQLVKIAQALHETRDVDVSPTEVALIALEAGLQQVNGGARAELAAAPKTNQPETNRPETNRPEAPAQRRASSSRSGSQSRSRKRSRRVSRDVTLDDMEKAELEALLSNQHTTRGRQRTIALWLGHRRKRIETEALRELAGRYACYDVANFAQNMKKDGALFRESLDSEGRRSGWRLTRGGLARLDAELRRALAGV